MNKKVAFTHLCSAFALATCGKAAYFMAFPEKPTPEPIVDVATYKQSAPKFEPDRWNDEFENLDGPPYSVQDFSNCYAYTNNFRVQDEKYYFPQPGLRHTLLQDTFNFLSSTYKNDIRKGAENDGLIPIKSGEKVPKGYYLAALVIQNGPFMLNDYHWYRLDIQKDGSLGWTHKPGSMKATDLDDAGKKIKSLPDVKTDYSQFGGYYLVPKGGLNIARMKR